MPPLPGASDWIGPPRRESCRATRGRRRRSRSPSAWAVDRWTRSCRSCTPARQTPSCPSSPGRSAPTTSLGHHDHAPAAHSHTGRRAQSRQGGTVVDPSLRHGQHPRQRGHPGGHEGRIPSHRDVLHPAAQHVVLAALRRGRLPQLQELHPDAGERHACPLRHRRLIRRPGFEKKHGGANLRPNGHLGRTCARRTRRGQLDGIACAQAATPSSAMP